MKEKSISSNQSVTVITKRPFVQVWLSIGCNAFEHEDQCKESKDWLV